MATPEPALPKDREEKAKASLDEFTAGAKYHNPSAADLKVVAFDYIVLGDYADAGKWLTKMLEWAPNDSDGWYNLGRTKYNENRFADQVRIFAEAPVPKVVTHNRDRMRAPIVRRASWIRKPWTSVR